MKWATVAVGAICLFAFPVISAGAGPLPPGEGSATMRVGDASLDLLTYRPDCPDPALLLVFHGAHRHAETAIQAAVPLANHLCLIAIAPEFDKERFSSWDYQRGGVADKRGVLDRNEWTINVVPTIVDWARRQEQRRMEYYLIGHSAGGQFLSRVAAYLPTEAKRIVVANPSTHVFPTLNVKAPYGMGGLYPPNTAEAELRRYLAAPVTIFLGQEDTGEKMLAEDSNADAQGETRIERGRNAFRVGEKVAASHHWPFNWRLVEVPGVGHDARKMYAAKEALIAIKP